MKRITLLILALCLTASLFAQDFDLPCGNLNYKPQVQTVLLYADDNQLNDPIIPLEDMIGRLTLSFDVIDGEGEVLNYTFIHCSHDWQPTDIQRIQYASGYDSDRLDNYAFSRNTLIDYVNYQLQFPTEDMMPIVSGNYLLVVYGDDMNDLSMIEVCVGVAVENAIPAIKNAARYVTRFDHDADGVAEFVETHVLNG